jgi:hypothetical protein
MMQDRRRAGVVAGVQMGPFECHGVWWLKENPSARVAGLLRASAEGELTLSLQGVLGESAGLVGEKKHPVILGASYDAPGGHLLTLRWCLQTGLRIGIPQFETERYYAECAFLGQHLHEDPDFLFPSCAVQISGLTWWAYHLKGISLEMASKEKQFGYQVTVKEPLPLRAVLPEGELQVSFTESCSSSVRETTVREKVSFHVNATSPLDEGVWNQRYVFPLLNFMIFATDSGNTVDRIDLLRSGRGPVQLIRHRVNAGPVAEDSILPHRMLFTLEDVQDGFADLIARWFELHAQHQDALAIFFGSEHTPGSYLDNRFFNTMQALEVYQRRRHDGGARNPVAPTDLLASLTAPQQEKLVRWLDSVHLDTFQYTLTGLFEEYEEVLLPLAPKGKTAFIEEAMLLRRHVVHRDADKKRLDDYTIRLHLMNQALRILMKACLLKGLGFDEKRVTSLFERNAYYGFIRGQIHKQFGTGATP